MAKSLKFLKEIQITTVFMKKGLYLVCSQVKCKLKPQEAPFFTSPMTTCFSSGVRERSENPEPPNVIVRGGVGSGCHVFRKQFRNGVSLTSILTFWSCPSTSRICLREFSEKWTKTYVQRSSLQHCFLFISWQNMHKIRRGIK